MLRLRLKQRRNLMATLLLSQGVPMFVAGDEFGRSQGGNNNAYCHDNEISWIDWQAISDEDKAFGNFVRRLIKLRQDHIVFRRHRFFFSRAIKGTEITDISWIRADGQAFEDEDWGSGDIHWVSFLVRGEAGEYHLTARGEPQPDDSFFVILNAHHDAAEWVLPSITAGVGWSLLFDADLDNGSDSEQLYEDGSAYPVAPRSTVVFVRATAAATATDGIAL